MKQHLSEWETSVDTMIMMNGNNLFIKNADKVRMTFYQKEESFEDAPLIQIKGTVMLHHIKLY